MTCERCKEPAPVWRMSWFNTEDICMACARIEEAHPDFEAAMAADRRAVQRGDHNYDGIGWPGVDGRVDPAKITAAMSCAMFVAYQWACAMIDVYFAVAV